MKPFTVLLLTFLFINVSFANKDPNARGEISGKIIDKTSKKPVEYASIALIRQKNNKMISGTISDEKGIFKIKKLPFGNYKIKITFVGYETLEIENIKLNSDKKKNNLGDIILKRTSNSLNELNVVAEKSTIEYKIDKKVVNVGKMITATSGTAVDILEKTPSVSVDVEGNVSLRGSSSFTVLIDGRPSVLDASEALQQMPATSIENIEIITNPSAKYDPDGTSGIVNIITKKNRLEGVNAVINLNAGLKDKYGSSILVNVRKKNIGFFFGADYRDFNFSGTESNEKKYFSNNYETIINSNGDNERIRKNYGLRGGLNINLGRQDLITLGFRYGGRSRTRNSDLNYFESNTLNNIENKYLSEDESKREGDFYSVYANFMHRFARKHTLSAKVSYRFRDMDENSLNTLYNLDKSIKESQKSTEKGPGGNLRFQIDYTMPITDLLKMETGWASRMGAHEDENEMYQYNLQTNQYDFLEKYKYNTDYKRDIHAAYTMFSGEILDFGYQLGLRAEYTNREISFSESPEPFKIDRWDFFPTVHTSYKLNEETQFMMSYARRIKRPRGWYLEPFITWTDAYNIRQGNPDLKPEYIDSYEIGMQKDLGESSLSLETYYRITNNKIERVQSALDTMQITLHTMENVGKDYSLGFEIMLNTGFVKWWDIDLMANFYDYKVEGKLDEKDFSSKSFNWTTRINNTFRLGKTRLQFSGNYHSSSATAQGTREAMWIAEAAIKHDFFKRKLSVTLQVRDVFSTGIHEFTTETPTYYSHTEFERESPMIMLNLTYRLNNQKSRKGRKNKKKSDDSFDDEDF